ncbi:zinc ribbon domain-containing protein [Streptomyces sp. 7-21]|jgi:hypothetical protein|uniref:zinc ribbon domain-containing protein n=1 Tax=Streptomyces sp. 7-21 TaxID=2802283 RepID=UPI00191EF28F|nr:zinc ribbon domain-containing protein [Streptomyces sp. 7-21]MBL1066558.1 zinc ribbon domain-containing protein [Streptomyces sp. 7-21]
MSQPAHRFQDTPRGVWEFLDVVLVRCPRCAQAARIIRPPGDEKHQTLTMFRPRRLVCRGCGLSRIWKGHSITLSRSTTEPATDPYLGLPLWLQTETRHGWLWAYNPEHLDLIRRYVQAPLRERANRYDDGSRKSLIARLPAWIKRAHHRDEILRAVDRIRASLTTG